MTLISSEPSSLKLVPSEIENPMEALLKVEAELCRRSLRTYVENAWHVVEPGTKFKSNWHIDFIIEYLEAATRGEIRNLIVNIPPRFMKSLLVSVFWPTWVWTFWPESRWLVNSYSEALAIRDAVKSRRLIRSAWYSTRFSEIFTLSPDQTLKTRYENTKTGFRVSLGVGGAATGEGGDFLVVDDPLKAQEADSQLARDTVNKWWDETLPTRINDPTTVVKVVIMQRLHSDDLTGHILEGMEREGADKFEHVCLPMRFEPNRFFSSIGLKDPRTKRGELLWPNRFPEKEVRSLEVTLGERGTAGQLQQRPAPVSGFVFMRDWWPAANRYNPEDEDWKKKFIATWLSYDTAMKDKHYNDYTAKVFAVLLADYRVAIIDYKKEKLKFPELTEQVERDCLSYNRDGLLRGALIEDRSSGISVIQTLSSATIEGVSDLIVRFNPGNVAKHTRARQAAVWCSRGCILLPRPSTKTPWLFELEEDLFNYPAIKFDDGIDAFSQVIMYLEHLIAEGWRLRIDAAKARKK